MQETQETLVWSLGGEDPLEKEMATHSSILTWRRPWTEESGRLLSIGLQRIRLDWSDSTQQYSLKSFSSLSGKKVGKVHFRAGLSMKTVSSWCLVDAFCRRYGDWVDPSGGVWQAHHCLWGSDSCYCVETLRLTDILQVVHGLGFHHINIFFIVQDYSGMN